MGGHAGCTERHTCLTDEHVREAGEYLQHCQRRQHDGIILVKIDDEVSTVGGDTDIITGAITTPTSVPPVHPSWGHACPENTKKTITTSTGKKFWRILPLYSITLSVCRVVSIARKDSWRLDIWLLG